MSARKLLRCRYGECGRTVPKAHGCPQGVICMAPHAAQGSETQESQCPNVAECVSKGDLDVDGADDLSNMFGYPSETADAMPLTHWIFCEHVGAERPAIDAAQYEAQNWRKIPRYGHSVLDENDTLPSLCYASSLGVVTSQHATSQVREGHRVE